MVKHLRSLLFKAGLWIDLSKSKSYRIIMKKKFTFRSLISLMHTFHLELWLNIWRTWLISYFYIYIYKYINLYNKKVTTLFVITFMLIFMNYSQNKSIYYISIRILSFKQKRSTLILVKKVSIRSQFLK